MVNNAALHQVQRAERPLRVGGRSMVRDSSRQEPPAVDDPESSTRREVTSSAAPADALQEISSTIDAASKIRSSVHALSDVAARALEKQAPLYGRKHRPLPPARPAQKIERSKHHCDGAEGLPLTIAQRGIWIGEKISRVGTVFNIAEAVEIHGAVDPDIFIAALQRITREVETTRVNIYENADGPRQRIHSEYRGEIPFIDCTGEPDPEQFARDWMMTDVVAPLDLERDPLWKSALLKVGSDHFFWHHRSHHIVSDGYTGGLISPRLAEIYNAELASEEPPPATFAPLRTLNEHEAAYRESKAFSRDRQYWLDRLTDLPDPVSFAQGRWPTKDGLARETAYISPTHTQQLRALAKSFSCSMPQLLIALTAAFIYRTTGAPDLVFGMPVAARAKATRNVPGLAANGIMLRLALRPDLDLESLANETAREVRHALRRQLYRFEDMRRDLGMTGQHQRFARIAVNIEPFDYNLTIGGHETTTHNLANSSVEDMVIFIYDRGDGKGLRIDFDANPSLYTKQELIAHRQRFECIVSAFLDEPDLSVSDIEILSEEEKQQQLVEWNDTVHSVPDIAAFQSIESNAEITPDAIAVRHGGIDLTYKELNERANYLARNLIARGVGAGDIVALALQRSELYPIAALGVNKTGAAFLPVDPADPPARLTQLFTDAKVHTIIAVSGIENDLPQGGAQLLNIDEVAAGFEQRNISNEERRKSFTLQDPAYVIYTSGSTGTPKGVILAHAGLTNMIADAVEHLSLHSDDKWMAVAALTFDASILDLYAPLVAGATLVIAPTGIGREPRKLAELMRSEATTTMLVTPPLWNALIATDAAVLSGLKIGVAGEALTSRLARTLNDLGAHVTNWYGPTEATVQCTRMPIDESECASPPIGKPIWNMRAYILDENLNLLPAGVAGELCIAGPGVALGYLNRPELTAERFPQDPFSKKGERLYRTGDLARWRSDGVLEFLGRRDQQLKVRGFRIEPGEVETALLDCPDVAAAFVTTIENPKGGRHLVAYVAPKNNAALEKRQLGEHLSKTLPEYLVPSAFFILESLPLTRNGKIDRNALPKSDDQEGKNYVAPRTLTEQKLADIFALMLGLERISIEDNFFELGADSLTAVQLLLEIETTFSTQLSLLSLFDAPTIANLARQMDNQSNADPFANVFCFRKHGDDAPLFCIHSSIGISWSYAGLLRHLSDRHPVYGLQARGLSDDTNAALPASVDAMAEDYLNEIRAIQSNGPYRLLGWSLGGLVTHSIAAKLEAMNENVEFLCLLDAFPFATHNNPDTQDEAFLADAALRFMNFKPENMNEQPHDLASLAQFMFHEFDVFSMPILKKTGFGSDDMKLRFQRVIANNFMIALNHRPPTVRAGIHAIRAAEGQHGAVGSLIESQDGAWRAYTTGRVVEHSIPCHHFEMLNPEPLAILGPIIRDAL